jgi:glycosyltransferase involved in cell wall biosynthesis
MGRAGRTRVEAHFSMQHMIDRYIELYEEVLDAGA